MLLSLSLFISYSKSMVTQKIRSQGQVVTLFQPLKNPQNSHEASSRWRHVASSPGTLLPHSPLQTMSFLQVFTLLSLAWLLLDGLLGFYGSDFPPSMAFSFSLSRILSHDCLHPVLRTVAKGSDCTGTLVSWEACQDLQICAAVKLPLTWVHTQFVGILAMFCPNMYNPYFS